MKSVKFERLFERLLASSALGLGLLLAGHPVLADETAKPQTEVAVPLPDYPQPLDMAPSANAAAPAAEPAKAAAPAAEPAKAAAPAPTVTADANSMLADKLRDIVTGKQLDRLVSRRAEREGVEQFYKARDYKPLWVSDGAAGDRAKAAIAYLAQVDSVGLDPNDYPVPNFAAATTPDALAEAEIKFTNSVLNYARQAEIGRIHFSRVGADIQFDLAAPEPAKVLAKLAEASDVGAALDSYNPPQPEFKALQEKLAELRKGPVAKPARRKAEAGRSRRRGQDPAPGHEGCARRPAAQAARHCRRQGLIRSTTTRCVTRSRRSRPAPISMPTATSDRTPCVRSTASARPNVLPPIRSTRSSSTWSAGAGCRATSAIRT